MTAGRTITLTLTLAEAQVVLDALTALPYVDEHGAPTVAVRIAGEIMAKGSLT